MSSKPGIVICTRLNSCRVPQKAIVEICGLPAIRILVERLLKTGAPEICVALSDAVKDAPIRAALKDFEDKIIFFSGHPDNPLARTFWAAEENGYDPVVRITHDDIIQDGELINRMIDFHTREKNDYTYISKIVRGMDCEIVGKALLKQAWAVYGNAFIEHLSYVFRHESLNAKIGEYTDSECLCTSSCSMSLDTQ